MKVWVIWDRLYERVISVHSTEESALIKIDKLYNTPSIEGEIRIEGSSYGFEFDEFEVEE